MLKFCLGTNPSDGGSALSDRLNTELGQGKKVLWLVCGGSSIPLAVQAMKNVPKSRQKQLTIALTDERYGEFDHPDSNWRQLRETGFDAGEATIIPTLAPNLSLADSVQEYEYAIAKAFTSADIVIAQFGIGADGHIAGALPHSPAITDDKLVVGYEAGQFTRITLTPAALRNIDVAFAFVYGESKRPALENLQKTLPVADEPAQILKEISESYIYNDQIGEPA